MDNHTPPQSIAITVAVIFVVFLAIAVTIAAAVTVGPAVVRRRKKRSNDTIPPILIILKTSKPYQIWYTQSNVGDIGKDKREYQRNQTEI